MKTTLNQQYNALFFPYADVTHTESLLLSAIWFDNIFVLEPDFFQSPTDQEKNVPSETSIHELVQEGVVKALGPELLGLGRASEAILDEENVSTILGSIRHDLTDESLQELVREYGYTAWVIPTGQQLFWNGMGLLLESFKAGCPSGLQIWTERVDYYRDLLVANGYSGIPLSRRTISRRRVGHDELEVEVPFLEAESLMITVSLLACSELNLSPITDHPLHYRFLMRKLQNPNIAHVVRDAQKDLSLSIKERELGIKSLEIYLPRMSGLTAERVLMIRNACSDSLQQFRLLMAKLKHSIEVNPWEDELDYKIKKLIDVEIVPTVQELKDRLRVTSKRLGFNLLNDALKFSPVPLLTTFATGLPIEWLLAASGGLIVLRDYIESQLKRAELKRNGLFFLLQLQSL